MSSDLSFAFIFAWCECVYFIALLVAYSCRCGLGNVIPKNRGFYTFQPNNTNQIIAISAPFHAFEIPPNDRVYFQCTVIVCHEGPTCEGVRKLLFIPIHSINQTTEYIRFRQFPMLKLKSPLSSALSNIYYFFPIYKLWYL